MEDNRFAGLDNEELVIIYDKFKEFMTEINFKLNKKILHEKKDDIVIVHHLTNDQVEEYKKSDYFKNVQSIVKKLEPIVDIIKDSIIESKTNSK